MGDVDFLDALKSSEKLPEPPIEAAQVIEELIDLAEREEALNLAGDEIVFYDALETNDSAVKAIPCGQ